MRGRAAAIGCALVLGAVGCGDGGEPARTADSDFAGETSTVVTDERAYTSPRPETYDPPAGEPVDGRSVVEEAGCLACQIGSGGNSGPGNNLDGIGARRSAEEIRRAIVSPRAGSSGAASLMPAYRDLPRRMLDALVAYLTSLRGECPEGSDCG